MSNLGLIFSLYFYFYFILDGTFLFLALDNSQSLIISSKTILCSLSLVLKHTILISFLYSIDFLDFSFRFSFFNYSRVKFMSLHQHIQYWYQEVLCAENKDCYLESKLYFFKVCQSVCCISVQLQYKLILADSFRWFQLVCALVSLHFSASWCPAGISKPNQ